MYPQGVKNVYLEKNVAEAFLKFHNCSSTKEYNKQLNEKRMIAKREKKQKSAEKKQKIAVNKQKIAEKKQKRRERLTKILEEARYYV